MGFAVCVFSTSDRLFEEQKVVVLLFLANRESVSPSTWARQAFRRAMHAGNSSAWNTVWGLMECSMKRIDQGPNSRTDPFNTFFHTGSSGRHVPRAIFVDLEPTVVGKQSQL